MSFTPRGSGIGLCSSSNLFQRAFLEGKILIRPLSSVNLDDCGTRCWYVDNTAIRFERH